MSDLKRGEVFVFLDGSLTVKLSGYGEESGWGQFSFDSKQVEKVPYEERDGYAIVVDLPNSELRELRDFLNRLFPPEGEGQ